MGELFKVLAAKIEEHSVAFVFLTAAISAVLGALAKLVFDTVLTGRYTDLKESRRVLSRYRQPLTSVGRRGPRSNRELRNCKTRPWV
jgi:hypothetical protein